MAVVVGMAEHSSPYHRLQASGGRADQIASLRPFATRNATFFDALLALILISSPVAGLRPLRAGRIRTCRTPRLGMRILLPFFSTRPMSATKPVNISIAWVLATP